MNNTVLISVIIIITVLLFWYQFLQPILKGITIAIDEKTSQKRSQLLKVLITFASAIIVLTLNLVNKDLVKTALLKISWFAILGCIVLCFLSFFFEYLRSNSNEIITNAEETGTEWRKSTEFKLATNERFLEKATFICLYLAVLAIITALISLTLFGSYNI